MTNFDLSSYIRWLKPGANTANEQQQSLEHRSVLLPQSANYIMGEDSKPSIFPTTDPFAAEFLSSPLKNELFERKVSVGSFGNKSSSAAAASSPTALSLLLRSSVFRELVEKNASMSGDDTDGEDIKNQTQLGGDEDDYAEIFCDSMGNITHRDDTRLQDRGLHFLL